MAAGILVLVVGPSGAGKDTVIDGARRALAGDARFMVARRVVTRPPAPDAEDHDWLTPDAFARAEAEGAFCLSWRAHGHGYGIPAGIADAVAKGAVVIANTSRGVIGDAQVRFSHVRVALITAPHDVLAARIAARGRDSDGDPHARTRRTAVLPPCDLVTIENDGPPVTAIATFTAFLHATAGSTPA